MKQLKTFIVKEFIHVFRDRKTLFILFGMPLMQILIFGFALTNEVTSAKVIIVDNAKDVASRNIISRIESSTYFEIAHYGNDFNNVEDVFKQGHTKLALIFPENFAKDLERNRTSQIRIIADASDPNIATTLTNYVSAVIRDYQLEQSRAISIPYTIIPEVKMLYNPELKGVHNFVPGVMALVLMLVCVMMTAVSIVREREIGTMEILLVSPFKPILVIVSKAIPYLILSLVNITTILLLSVFVFDLPVNGSLLLLYAESTLFIITCLSVGIVISLKVKSQQQAMLISLVGMLLPTMLFSGFMYPIENMPLPLQIFSNIVPAKWFYIIVKDIMIKGMGIASIWKETLVLVFMTLVLLIISVRSFKIRLS